MRLRQETTFGLLLGTVAVIGLGCSSPRTPPAAPAAPPGSLPDGWQAAGSHPDHYAMGFDDAMKREGRTAVALKARPEPQGFGTVMARAAADPYRGKKLRLSAIVKCQDVAQAAGLWMRVDGRGTRPLAFANMGDRPIRGTLDWQRYEVVLPVASDAQWVAYGLRLRGRGSAWLDEVKLDVVPDSVPATGGPKPPANLGFDE